jgi:hypothetical protein
LRISEKFQAIENRKKYISFCSVCGT